MLRKLAVSPAGTQGPQGRGIKWTHCLALCSTSYLFNACFNLFVRKPENNRFLGNPLASTGQAQQERKRQAKDTALEEQNVIQVPLNKM